MMRVLPLTSTMVAILSGLFINQMDAYCARCVKIEEERAKEQAAHPQAFHYYDDFISLQSDHLSSDKKTSRSSDDASSSTGTGALKGSTYRSTEVNKSLKSSDTAHHSFNKQQNLAENEQPINEQFFEEDDIPGATKSQESDHHSPRQGNEERGAIETGTFDFLSSQNYSMLYTIFKTKNFLETLDGSFTLFIPTNQAFQQISPKTLINLTQPENAEKLASLVANHLIARKILRTDFIKNNNLEVKAISGRNLTLSYKDDKLYVENIPIISVEPAGYDGVIYVIDKILTSP